MRQLGDGARRRELHGFIDPRRRNVERTSKNIRKAEDVVYLIGKIRPPGADQRVRARRDRHTGFDFRRGIGERHDQRLAGHLLCHLRRQDAPGRKPEENIGAADDILEGSRVGVLCINFHMAVHQSLAAAINDAFDVGDENIFCLGAESDEEIETGKGRGACARGHDLDVADGFAGDLHGIEDRRADDDRGAMLIIVKHGYRHAFAQLALDLETFGRLDILKIDTAKGWLQRGHDIDQAIDIVFGDFDIENIDPGEFLEKNRLAFHHRFAGQRADVAEPQDRGPVGQHRDEVLPDGEVGGCMGIGGDRKACGGDAWRIGERQIMLRGQRLGRHDLKFAGARRTVVEQRA